MDCGHSAESGQDLSSPGAERDSPVPSPGGGNSINPCLAPAAVPRSGAAPGRPAAANAARERSRVQTLRHAFLELQRTLPSVPPDTKLSKLDTLRLASSYIAHLRQLLQEDRYENGYVHPVNLVRRGGGRRGTPGKRGHPGHRSGRGGSVRPLPALRERRDGPGCSANPRWPSNRGRLRVCQSWGVGIGDPKDYIPRALGKLSVRKRSNWLCGLACSTSIASWVQN